MAPSPVSSLTAPRMRKLTGAKLEEMIRIGVVKRLYYETSASKETLGGFFLGLKRNPIHSSCF